MKVYENNPYSEDKRREENWYPYGAGIDPISIAKPKFFPSVQ